MEQANLNPLALRLGTAVRVPIGIKALNFRLGGSVGLGHLHGSPSFQLGAVAQAYILALGYSRSFEWLDESLPKNTVDKFSYGLVYGPAYVGYADEIVHSIFPSTRSNVISARWTGERWTFYGAVKRYSDYRGDPQRWWNFLAQRKIGKHFGLSYLYGYFPGSHSLGLEFYL